MRFGRALGWSVLGRTVYMITGTLMTILVARFVGPTAYGQFAVLGNLLAWATLLTGAGLSGSVSRYVTELNETAGGAGVRELLLWVLGVQFGLAILLAGVSFTVLNALHVKSEVATLGLACVVVAIGLLTNIRETFSQFWSSHYQTGKVFLSQLAYSLVVIACLVGFTSAVRSVMSVFQGQFLATFVGVVVLAWPARRMVLHGRLTRAFRHRMFRWGLTAAAAGIINQVAQRQSETLFLGYYWGALVAGTYDLGFSLPFLALSLIPVAASAMGTARLTTAAVEGRSQFHNALRTYFKVIFAVSVPISLFGFTLGDKLLTLLYGPAMQAAGPILRYYSLVQAVGMLSSAASLGLWVQEKAYVNVRVGVGIALLNLLTGFFLVPRFGIAGAIASASFILIVGTGSNLYLAHRHTGSTGVVPFFVVRCYVASSPVLTLLLFRDYTTSALGILLMVVVGLALCAIGYWVCKVLDSDVIEMLVHRAPSNN